MPDALQQIRDALAQLPEGAEVFLEDRNGGARYEVVRADAWGTKTDEPFLRMLIRWVPRER